MDEFFPFIFVCVLSVSLGQRSGHVYILVTDNHADSIWKIDVNNSSCTAISVTDHINPIALDYDPVQNKIYWTDVSRKDIRCCGFDGEDVTLVYKLNSGAVQDGMVLDPISRLIFYTDTGNDVIGLIELKHYRHKTVIDDNLNEPRGIALERKNGLMYWTDWGTQAKIERSTYLGENRTVLVSSGLGWPNGITLDIQAQKIFWCDAKLDKIEVLDFDGSNRRKIKAIPLQHPYDIFLFENVLYTTDWKTRKIHVYDLNGGSDYSLSNSRFEHLNGIHVFRVNKFKNVTNACTIDNGACEHICVPTSTGRQCTCSDGFSILSDGLRCARNCSSTGSSCNVHFNNSHIIYENGTVQKDSGGICVAPDNCTDCNKGFYPAAGYCNICHSINNCDFEECTTGSDETCSHCEGVVSETAGLRAYVMTSDKRSCRKACSWRHDSTRCYPGQCDGELADNCKCHPGFTGHHCETITKKPGMDILVKILDGDQTVFEIVSKKYETSFWTRIITFTLIHYSLTAEFIVHPPKMPSFIKYFKTGIVQGTLNFKLVRDNGSLIVTNNSRSCTYISNPKPNLTDCLQNINASLLSPDVLPLQNNDRLEFLFKTSSGGSVKVRNMETNMLETFAYKGQTYKMPITINTDYNKPYHCSVRSDCGHKMFDLDNIIKSVSESKIYIRMDGWMDDESGISTINIRVIQLYYSSGKLRVQLGNSFLQTSLKYNLDQTAEFTVTSPGVYTILLSVFDKAQNERKARRIIMYDPFSTITVNEAYPIRVTSASASTNYTWQVNTKKVTVDFTDRFVNKLQTTNNWLAAVADDTDIDTQYDDQEGERTLLEVVNKQGIVQFETAYLINPKREQMEREPKEDLFEDQGLKTVVEITPRVEDGDLIILWVKAFDIKHNVKTENVHLHIDSSPPEIRRMTVEEIENNKTTLWVSVADKQSGIERISWAIIDSNSGTVLVYQEKHISPIENITGCNKSQSLSCYCTQHSECFSTNHQLTLTQEVKTNYTSTVVTVWNRAHISVTIQKPMIPFIQTPLRHLHVGEEHSFVWGLTEQDEIQFYNYSFGLQCYSLEEITSEVSDIQVNMSTQCNVSWSPLASGKYHLTVVAFDNSSLPIHVKCSDIITVDDNRKMIMAPSIYIPLAISAVSIIILIFFVSAFGIYKRQCKKQNEVYENIDIKQITVISNKTY